jgi:HEAT repeat protein
MTSPEHTRLMADPLPFLTHDEAALRRLAVAACAGRLAEEPIRSAIEERLARDDDGAVRAEAVEILGGAGADVTELIMEARLDDDPRVVEAVATGLGELGATAAVPWLIDTAVGHPDRLVREAAVAALGAIGDPRGLPVLLQILATGPPQVRRRAVVALTVFDDPAVEPALLAARSDRNPMVREVAEMVVGRGLPDWAEIRLRTADKPAG